jgi:uncharacterized protein with FMN-binding domain
MATKNKASGGNKRLSSSLVALGSAMIATVYATGYVRTQSAADQVALAAASQTAAVRPASATSSSPGVGIAPATTTSPSGAATSPPTSPTATPQLARGRVRGTTRPASSQAPVPTSTPAASSGVAAVPSAATSQAAAKYKDGTYTGTGYSRHGGIQATVVIQGGKIVSANVSGCSTRYPCSVVSRLPAQVVAQQTAQVDYVSGATDSSMAYQGAVEQALSKASA